ncbi:BACON domain-containing protein [Dysgonomonas sp. HGC4]|uniref:BACON domain-containing protein n=1 Tax=Dysgonomonas sp. HGC4 TaxID=1658009 RepID=UPI00068016CD|nr:BACON domain-containing protein [Dysgonomonas sp. HGC4]
MKSIFMKNVCLLIAVLFCFVACSEDEKETVLILSTLSLHFVADEETKTFDIQSNVSWSISGIPEWCILDVKEGEGNKRIEIKAIANPNDTQREVILVVKAGNKSEQLLIQQNGKVFTLNISESLLTFSADEEELSFDIQTNDSWSITGLQEWFSLSLSEGKGNETIVVKAQANTSEVEREGILVIKSGSESEQIVIKQIGKVYSLTLSESVLDFLPEGEIRGFAVESDGSWTVSSNAAWCIVDDGNGMGNETISISVLENQKETTRSAEVTVTCGSLLKKVIINQMAGIISSVPYIFNLNDNRLRAGDQLVKRQVEYKDPGQSGANVTWDFSNLVSINDEYTVDYKAPVLIEGTHYIMGDDRLEAKDVAPNSLIIAEEHNTMYYFQLKDNKMITLGHENPVTLLKYTTRLFSDAYTTSYGDKQQAPYYGKGLYSGKSLFTVEGKIEMNADAYGTLILPSGRVLKNVLRIKTVRSSTQTNLSINPDYTTYNRSEFTTYKWYAKGYRYPIFETIVNIDTDTNAKSILSFYFAPEKHTYRRINK